MGAYSKLLGLWSPLYRSLGCNATIVHLPDFDQLTVANLVNLILMEEPPDSLVRFNMEQMELFECLNIKLSGLKEIPGDVEIKKVEVKEVKRTTRSSGAVAKNVATLPEKVKVAPPVKVQTPPVKLPTPPGIEAEEPVVSYMCDLCDSKVTSIEKHLEAEHEEIMPIPIGEISTFFTLIPPTKVVQKKPAVLIEENNTTRIDNEPKNVQKSESSPPTKSSKHWSRRPTAYDGPDGIKCPSCPRIFARGAAKLKDNLRCHIGMIHYGQELLAEVEKFYQDGKCKECGRDGKDNAQKKKHMLFHHTGYVAEVLNVVDKAIKGKKEDREEDGKSKLAKVADGDLNGSKRKREEGHSEEESKSLKVDPKLKVADLEKLTTVTTAHAEVEDLLMSDDEDDLEDAHDTEANAEEDVNLEEALDAENAKDEQSSEVLSIQDQLLQMQDLSSEEDEDEDADDRLKEFVGEGLSEEENEDLDDEKAGEQVEPADGDYDIDVGNLISDEDIADDIADDESPEKDQNEKDFGEDDFVGTNEPAAETHDDDLGNISDDDEEEEASEDNLEDVLNFENGEDDGDGDTDTAPNSDQEEESEAFASAMSTEMLEKLDNLLSS